MRKANHFALLMLWAALCAPLGAQETERLPLPEPEGMAAAAPAETTNAAAVTAAAPQAEPSPAQEQPASGRAAVQVDALAGPRTAIPAGPVDVVEAEKEFLRGYSASSNEKALAMIPEDMEDWLARNPDNPGAHDVLLEKAMIRYRLGDHKGATMDLLRLFRAYPGSPVDKKARGLFSEIMAKKADKKLRPILEEASSATNSGSLAADLSALLRQLTAKAGEAYLEPLTAEYRRFFNTHPTYEGNDEMRLALAGLYRINGELVAAKLAYEKMIRLHPSSPLQAAAKLSLAGLLTEDLKEHDAAIQVYQAIVDSYPGSPEAWEAYLRLPKLAEKRDKFQLAVDTYERIILLYPDREEAFLSLKSAARVLREELDKFPEAVAVLFRLADNYKDARGAEALMLAAEIYRKDLKDQAGEIKVYDRLAADFGKDPLAPKALFAAGEIHEKAKDFDKARSYYSAVTEKYQQDPLAKKAQKRLDGLLAR